MQKVFPFTRFGEMHFKSPLRKFLCIGCNVSVRLDRKENDEQPETEKSEKKQPATMHKSRAGWIHYESRYRYRKDEDNREAPATKGRDQAAIKDLLTDHSLRQYRMPGYGFI